MDERLRSIARQVGAQPGVEAEAAWLRERVRVGELSEAKVRLAAWLGHAAARACLGEEARAPDDAREWLEALEQREPGMALRACLEAVRVVVEEYDRAGREVPGRADIERVASSISDMVACPCEWHVMAHSHRMYIGSGPPNYGWLAHSLFLVGYCWNASERTTGPLECWEVAATRLAELGVRAPAERLRELVSARLATHILTEDRAPGEPIAAALHARWRAGELTLEQLRVAAACGHVPACVALGLSPPAAEPASVEWLVSGVPYVLREAGRSANEVASRAVKRAAGLPESAPGVGSRTIPDSDFGGWLRAVPVGWHVSLPAVRDALLAWALGPAAGDAKREEKEH